jgi:hypothetical protein
MSPESKTYTVEQGFGDGSVPGKKVTGRVCGFDKSRPDGREFDIRVPVTQSPDGSEQNSAQTQG